MDETTYKGRIKTKMDAEKITCTCLTGLANIPSRFPQKGIAENKKYGIKVQEEKIMKKKSIMALGLAAVLAMGTCVPVLAEATVTNYPGAKDGISGAKTEVSLNQAVGYNVLIPASVDLSSKTSEIVAVTLSETGLMLGENGGVKIATDCASDGMTLKAGSTVLKASVTTTDSDTLKSADDKVEYTITPETVTKAGEYKGTINFTITYEEGSAN